MPPRLSAEALRVDAIVGPVDLSVAAGECLALSGPSGVGKTLLLRAVADLTPHAGVCRLDGAAAEEFSPDAWRSRVVYVAAESAWWHDTVGPHMGAVSDGDLAALGFEPTVMDWSVTRLSSGERQRLALLRSLALTPAVLLLDEPTAHLDADNTVRVERWLADFRRQHQAAVLWVAHDAGQRERVADRQATLADGRLQCS